MVQTVYAPYLLTILAITVMFVNESIRKQEYIRIAEDHLKTCKYKPTFIQTAGSRFGGMRIRIKKFSYP